MQNAKVIEAAKILLSEPSALDELAKAITFCKYAGSYEKLRIGLNFTIDPPGKGVPDEIHQLSEKAMT